MHRTIAHTIMRSPQFACVCVYAAHRFSLLCIRVYLFRMAQRRFCLSVVCVSLLLVSLGCLSVAPCAAPTHEEPVPGLPLLPCH